MGSKGSAVGSLWTWNRQGLAASVALLWLGTLNGCGPQAPPKKQLADPVTAEKSQESSEFDAPPPASINADALLISDMTHHIEHMEKALAEIRELKETLKQEAPGLIAELESGQPGTTARFDELFKGDCWVAWQSELMKAIDELPQMDPERAQPLSESLAGLMRHCEECESFLREHFSLEWIDHPGRSAGAEGPKESPAMGRSRLALPYLKKR